MNRTAYIALGALLATGASFSIGTGCGSSTNTGAGGTASTSTTTTSSATTTTTGTTSSSSTTSTSTSTSTSSSTSSSSTSSSSGGDAGPPPTCAAYCTAITANCKNGPAPDGGADAGTVTNEQYSSMDACLESCSAFPVGNSTDMGGDTLGCRLYHANAALSTGNAVLHCPHAGPTGGDKDPTDTVAGTCGEGCAAFCEIAQKVCTGANSQYASVDLCKTECKMFHASPAFYNDTDTNKNDFGCRMYHLTVAASGVAAGGDAGASTTQTHCPHIKLGSATCVADAGP